MGKGLIYSCMVGSRSTILPLKFKETDVDYAMYTDDPGQAVGSGWTVVPLPRSKTKAYRAQSRVYKWDLGVLPDGYDWVMWIDSTHVPRIPLKDIIEKRWLLNDTIAAFPHPIRTCSYLEIDACVSRNKDSKPVLAKAREYLKGMEAKSNTGLFALGLVARRVCYEQRNFGIDLLKPLISLCPRDQIFFVPFMEKHGLKCHGITPGSVYNSEFFSYYGPHG